MFANLFITIFVASNQDKALEMHLQRNCYHFLALLMFLTLCLYFSLTILFQLLEEYIKTVDRWLDTVRQTSMLLYAFKNVLERL